MTEPRERHGFASEPFDGVFFEQVRVEHFDRDDAIEGFVEGLIDRAHAAAPDLLEDFVLADGAADHVAMIPACSGWHQGKYRKQSGSRCGLNPGLTARSPSGLIAAGRVDRT